MQFISVHLEMDMVIIFFKIYKNIMTDKQTDWIVHILSVVFIIFMCISSVPIFTMFGILGIIWFIINIIKLIHDKI